MQFKDNVLQLYVGKVANGMCRKSSSRVFLKVGALVILHLLLAAAQLLPNASIRPNSPSFNPSRGEKLALSLLSLKAGPAVVLVYDSDFDLIRKLQVEGQKKEVIWDGRDLEGRTVPNEAYFFVIEATPSGTALYDPVAFSGGEIGDVPDGRYDAQTGVLVYKLNRPSRVRIRGGVPGGALLKTILDWEPRPAGEITDLWNGHDEDRLWWTPKSRQIFDGFKLTSRRLI